MVQRTHLFGEFSGHGFGSFRQFASDVFAGAGQTRDNISAMVADLLHERFAGAGQREADLFALRAQRSRDARAGVADAVGNLAACLFEFFGKVFVCAGDRQLHAVGIGGNRLALGGQFIDKSPHAAFVVGIGAFEIGNLRTHHCFEFACAGERTLDPVAHGGDFASNGLREGHDLFGRHGFRLRETDCDFCHGASGEAHFLRTADHGSGDKEEDRGADGGKSQECEIMLRHRKKFASAPQTECIKGGKAKPTCGEQKTDHHGGARRTHLQSLKNLPDGALIIIGRNGCRARRLQRRCRALGERLVDAQFRQISVVDLGQPRR